MGIGRVPFQEIEHQFKSTGNPRLIYIGTDQMAYELDEGQIPTDQRELSILIALLKPAAAEVRVKSVSTAIDDKMDK